MWNLEKIKKVLENSLKNIEEMMKENNLEQIDNFMIGTEEMPTNVVTTIKFGHGWQNRRMSEETRKEIFSK